MQLTINGQLRSFPELGATSTVGDLIAELSIKADRVAVERNGEIVPRTEWPRMPVSEFDRFEIVHFVGGGRA